MNNPLTTEFSDRLVTLPDGRAGLRGMLQIEAREPDPSTSDTRPSSPCLDFISSDETLDRYGEIIAASGWRLENYRRNPVFQNAHQYGDVIFTLGRALITEIRRGASGVPSPGPERLHQMVPPSERVAGAPSPGGEGGGESERVFQLHRSGGGEGGLYLFQRIEFATEVNPMARIAYGLYKGKFLNAVSVGFIPLRWQDAPSESSSSSSSFSSSITPAPFNLDATHKTQLAQPLPNSDHTAARTPAPALRPSDTSTIQRAHAAPIPRRRYLEQELLEVSAVGIPANPNALALGLKSGAVEKSDLRELNELIRQTLGDDGRRREEMDWQPVPIKIKPRQDFAELLRLAKEVRELLKA